MAGIRFVTHVGKLVRKFHFTVSLTFLIRQRWIKTGSVEYSHKKKQASKQVSISGVQCVHCGIKNARIWRTGPAGPRNLCDDCGISWRHGKLLDGSEATNKYASTDDEEKEELAPCVQSMSSKNRKRTQTADEEIGDKEIGDVEETANGEKEDSNLVPDMNLFLYEVEKMEGAANLMQQVLQSRNPDFEQFRLLTEFISRGLQSFRS